MRTVTKLSFGFLIATASVTAFAQRPPEPEATLKAQREAMSPLAFMDGEWRGAGWAFGPTGEKNQFTQTERVGHSLAAQ